ncbi:hypothetical protein EA462_00280 [Natrarchaeobius halalkaliphilus]|uniref:CARDB domain-containing protein n=1 Tax=Natrarchaeobius halalkaliphilus TaxID=1679091 RepID=A0A3N6LVG2_9EURY|nr:CARDB domain-containing protein [Natrarchaeobius halalkaliphilus]RQG92707.1 hypothetical protein EA462_00280 [Natrarchaeobius halalkaliphilus]
MTSRLIAIVFVVLMIASLPAGVGAFESAEPTASPAAEPASLEPIDAGSITATTATESTLYRTTTLRHLPDRSGTFETEKEFRVPDPVVDLEIGLHSRAEVESTEGFEETGDGTLEWTEETDRPSVRFTMPANRTGDVGAHALESGGSPETSGEVPNEPTKRAMVTATIDERTEHARTATTADERYTFVDTGEWGVVQVPGIDISLRQTESVGHDETVRVDGPGATGGDIAFFGEVEEHQRTVDGETIRLVVSESAEMAEEPSAVLETLTYASRELDVGARPDEAFIVAVPTDVNWGPEGVQYGDGDAWVRADAPLENPANIWVHEYVHVRQDFSGSASDARLGPEAEWLVEAQAEYYAATIAFEKGLIEFDELKRHLERGERAPYADGILADPPSWEDDRTDYVKGRLVYAEIDRVLRLETEGDRTLEDVFRVMNANEEGLTGDGFLELLEDAGGEAVRATAERYTLTDATPGMWSRSEHAAAFDLEGAAFAYRLGPEPLEVADEPWEDGYVTAERDAVVVPMDTSVTVPATVENVGDRDGTYDASLVIDGDIVDYNQSALPVGRHATERLAWTPPEPGDYALRVGSDELAVFVRTASSVTVTDLSIDPEPARPGEPVDVTATVEAAGDGPGTAVIEFRTEDGVVAERTVVVASDERKTINASVQFDEEGTYELVVGDRETTVTIEAVPPADLEEVPGFGVGTAIGSLLAAITVILVGKRWTRPSRR